MNLLERFLPDLSGHIYSLDYFSAHETLEVVFSDGPEDFVPTRKLTFSGVKDWREDLIDVDANCIELAIGLDSVGEEYCLHTEQREITFVASTVEAESVYT